MVASEDARLHLRVYVAPRGSDAPILTSFPLAKSIGQRFPEIEQLGV